MSQFQKTTLFLAFMGLILMAGASHAAGQAPTGCPAHLVVKFKNIETKSAGTLPDVTLDLNQYWKSDRELAPGSAAGLRVVDCYYEEVNCAATHSCRSPNYQLSYYPDTSGHKPDSYQLKTVLMLNGERFDLQVPLSSFSESTVEPRQVGPQSLDAWSYDEECIGYPFGCVGKRYEAGKIGVIELN